MTNRPESDGSRNCWYALWVYRNLVKPIISLCDSQHIVYYIPIRLSEHYTAAGVEYVQETIIPNLLFVKTTAEFLEEIKRTSQNRGIAYCYPGTRIPAPIDDRIMEIFMMVVKKGGQGVEAVELPVDKGDKVRVIGGMFKEAEGYVRRVHGSRRFVVAIEGVADVSLTLLIMT